MAERNYDYRPQWTPTAGPVGEGSAMIGLIIAIIIGIILIGIVLKVLKVAIIIALAVGIVMLAQNKFGPKRLK
jgi:hypothetical protein